MNNSDSPFLDIPALLNEDERHVAALRTKNAALQTYFLDLIKTTADEVVLTKTGKNAVGWMRDWTLHPVLNDLVKKAPTETLAHIPSLCVKHSIEVAVQIQKKIAHSHDNLHYYTILKAAGGHQSILYNNITIVNFVCLRAFPSNDTDFETLHAILRIVTEIHKQTNDADSILFYMQCLMLLSNSLKPHEPDEACTLLAKLPNYYQTLLDKYACEPCGWLALRLTIPLPNTSYAYAGMRKGTIANFENLNTKKERYKIMDVSVSGGGVGPAVRILDESGEKTIIYLWNPEKHSGVFYSKTGVSRLSSFLLHTALVFRKFAIMPTRDETASEMLHRDMKNIAHIIPALAEDSVIEFFGPMRPLWQWAMPPALFKLYTPPFGSVTNGGAPETDENYGLEITIDNHDDLMLVPNSDYATLLLLNSPEQEDLTAEDGFYARLDAVYAFEVLKHETEYDTGEPIDY